MFTQTLPTAKPSCQLYDITSLLNDAGHPSIEPIYLIQINDQYQSQLLIAAIQKKFRRLAQNLDTNFGSIAAHLTLSKEKNFIIISKKAFDIYCLQVESDYATLLKSLQIANLDTETSNLMKNLISKENHSTKFSKVLYQQIQKVISSINNQDINAKLTLALSSPTTKPKTTKSQVNLSSQKSKPSSSSIEKESVYRTPMDLLTNEFKEVVEQSKHFNQRIQVEVPEKQITQQSNLENVPQKGIIQQSNLENVPQKEITQQSNLENVSQKGIIQQSNVKVPQESDYVVFNITNILKDYSELNRGDEIFLIYADYKSLRELIDRLGKRIKSNVLKGMGIDFSDITAMYTDKYAVNKTSYIIIPKWIFVVYHALNLLNRGNSNDLKFLENDVSQPSIDQVEQIKKLLNTSNKTNQTSFYSQIKKIVENIKDEKIKSCVINALAKIVRQDEQIKSRVTSALATPTPSSQEPTSSKIPTSAPVAMEIDSSTTQPSSSTQPSGVTPEVTLTPNSTQPMIPIKKDSLTTISTQLTISNLDMTERSIPTQILNPTEVVQQDLTTQLAKEPQTSMMTDKSIQQSNVVVSQKSDYTIFKITNILQNYSELKGENEIFLIHGDYLTLRNLIDKMRKSIKRNILNDVIDFSSLTAMHTSRDAHKISFIIIPKLILDAYYALSQRYSQKLVQNNLINAKHLNELKLLKNITEPNSDQADLIKRSINPLEINPTSFFSLTKKIVNTIKDEKVKSLLKLDTQPSSSIQPAVIAREVTFTPLTSTNSTQPTIPIQKEPLITTSTQPPISNLDMNQSSIPTQKLNPTEFVQIDLTNEPQTSMMIEPETKKRKIEPEKEEIKEKTGKEEIGIPTKKIKTSLHSDVSSYDDKMEKGEKEKDEEELDEHARAVLERANKNRAVLPGDSWEEENKKDKEEYNKKTKGERNKRTSKFFEQQRKNLVPSPPSKEELYDPNDNANYTSHGENLAYLPVREFILQAVHNLSEDQKKQIENIIKEEVENANAGNLTSSIKEKYTFTKNIPQLTDKTQLILASDHYNKGENYENAKNYKQAITCYYNAFLNCLQLKESNRKNAKIHYQNALLCASRIVDNISLLAQSSRVYQDVETGEFIDPHIELFISDFKFVEPWEPKKPNERIAITPQNQPTSAEWNFAKDFMSKNNLFTIPHSELTHPNQIKKTSEKLDYGFREDDLSKQTVQSEPKPKPPSPLIKSKSKFNPATLYSTINARIITEVLKELTKECVNKANFLNKKLK